MARPLLRAWWPLVAVAALLALAALVAPRSGLRVDRVEPPERDHPGLPSFPPEQNPVRPSFAAHPRDVTPVDPGGLPAWVTDLAVGLCAVTVLAVVGLLLVTLVRERGRRRTRALPAQSTLPTARDAAEVVAVLDAGLVDLSDTDADPRRAVIACWVRLEQAAAAAGTPRRVGDTPTDLVTRLLRGHEISGAVLAAFAQVYREARYASRPVDERMRAEARSALRRLRAELTDVVQPRHVAQRESVES